VGPLLLLELESRSTQQASIEYIALVRFDTISKMNLTTDKTNGSSANDDATLSTDIIDHQDSCTSFIETRYQRMRSAIDWILYALHADTSLPFWAAYLILITEAIQWTFFAFHSSDLYEWNHSWSNWLALTTKYTANFLAVNLRGYYAAVALTGAFYLFAVLAVWGQRYLRLVWPMTAYRFMISFALRPLLLPILNSHARMAFGCLHGLKESNPHSFFDLPCGTLETKVYIGVAVVCIVLTWYLAVLVAINFVELNPNQRTDLGDHICAFARANGRGDALNIFGRVFCVIFFVVFAQFHYAQWPLALLLLAVGLVNVWYQLSHLPYYHRGIQVATVWNASVIAWTGICLVVNNIQFSDHYGALLMLYSMWPLLIATSYLSVRARVDQLIAYSELMLTEPHLVTLKSRLTLYEGFHTFGLDKPWVSVTPEQEAYRDKLYKDVEVIYQLGTRRFPKDPWLHIHFALYYSCYIHNKPMAFREIMAAAENASAPDVRFFIFLMRARSDVESSMQRAMDTQVKSYSEFKDRSNAVAASSRNAARAMLEFWSELIRASPSTDRLVRLAAVGRISTVTALTHYQRLLEINPTSIVTLRSFGGFVLDFHGDLSMSSQLLHRADELEEARSDVILSTNSELKLLALQRTNLDIYDERNAVLSISLESHNFASIVSCNAVFRRITGYTLATELMNRNVNIIIPEPISSIHDSLLSAFLRRNKSDILNTTRAAFCVHKRGHIVPVDINLRWSDSTMSRIVCVMKPIVTEDDQIVFDKSNDHVTYCTQNAYALFGISRDQIANKDIYISGMFPHLSLHRATTGKARRRREFLYECANSPQGLILPMRNFVDDRLSLVRIWMYTVQVQNEFISVCRLTRKIEREHLLSNANVIGFSEFERTGHGVLDQSVDNMLRITTSWRWRRPEDNVSLKLTRNGWVVYKARTRSGTEADVNDFNTTETLTSNARFIEDYSEQQTGIEAQYTVQDQQAQDEEEDEDDLSPSSPKYHSRFIQKPVRQPSPRASNGRSVRGSGIVPVNIHPMPAPGRTAPGLANRQGSMAHLGRFGSDGESSGDDADSDDYAMHGVATALASPDGDSSLVSKAQQRIAASAANLIDTKSYLKSNKTKGADVGTPDHTDGGLESNPLLGLDADNRSVRTDENSVYSDSSAGSSSIADAETKMLGNRHILHFIREQTAYNQGIIRRAHVLVLLGVIAVLVVMVAMFVVTKNSIADNEIVTDYLVSACHRRLLAVNLLGYISALELSRLGFYDAAYFDYAKDVLNNAVVQFRELDAKLYDERLATPEGRDYFLKPSITFYTLTGGNVETRLYNLKEYSQAYINAAAASLAIPIERANPEAEPSLYMVVQNALTTVPPAYHKAVVHLKDAVDQIYRNMLRLELVVFCVVVLVAAVLIGWSFIHALQVSQEQSSDVMLLFLSLPKTVVKLLQKRFAAALKHLTDEEEDMEIFEVTKRAGAQDGKENDEISDDSSVSSMNDSEYTDDSGMQQQELANVNDTSYLARHRVAPSRQLQMRASLRRVQVITGIKFGLMLSFLVIYVAVLLTRMESVRIENEDATDHLERSVVRTESLVGARYYMRRWPLGLEPITSTKIVEYLEQAENAATELLYHSATLFRDKAQADQRDFHYTDCCTKLGEVTLEEVPLFEIDEMKQDCDTYMGGIMANGLQEAFATFILSARRLATPTFYNVIAAALTVNSGVPGLEPPGSPKFEAVKEYMIGLYTLARVYIEPGLAYSTTLYGQGVHHLNSRFDEFTEVWFACWLSVCAVYYLLIIRPSFNRLHDSVRSSQALLLAIPPDVVMKVPQVNKFLQDVFEHNQGISS